MEHMDDMNRMNHIYTVGDKVHNGSGRTGVVSKVNPMGLAKTQSIKVRWDDDNSIELFVGPRKCCKVYPVTN